MEFMKKCPKKMFERTKGRKHVAGLNILQFGIIEHAAVSHMSRKKKSKSMFEDRQ